MMTDKDIVYFVKDTDVNEELRYSLRSVEKNFPHRRVWFFGGCPMGLKPDVLIRMSQNAGSKYMNVRNMIKTAVGNVNISDDFWLFNDDFFVMSKVGYVTPAIDGSLARKVQKIERKYGRKTNYSNKLRNTVFALRDLDKDRLNYELHIPMEIIKKKATEILKKFDDNTAFRSTYGNYFDIAREVYPDVKIYDTESTCDPDIHNVFLSTSDRSFCNGAVGREIRRLFPDPSRFEDEESMEV